MKPGDRVIFTYPSYFSLFPAHRAHSGQIVTVMRELVDGVEYDGPNTYEGEERMFLVRADDGWEDHVFESELAVP